MKRQQQNSTGQSGRQPKGRRFASSRMSCKSTAASCRTAVQIAVDRRSLLGSCCCAGPCAMHMDVDTRHSPLKGTGKYFLGQIRSPKAKKSFQTESTGAEALKTRLRDQFTKL